MGDGMKLEIARDELLKGLEKYPQAAALFRKAEEDVEIKKLQNLANNFTVNRLGYNDHGRTHAYIVARNALELLDLCADVGITPNVVREGIGTLEDAAKIVVLAGFLHDIGNAVHREDHHIHGVVLAEHILRRLLKDEEKENMLRAMILEAIYSHEEVPAVSVEASIVKVADGMDMEEGRARIPYSRGKFDIHAVSALSIKKVSLEKGKEKPIRIVVEMEHTAGLFQVEMVLGKKIRASLLAGKIEVLLRIPSIGERLLFF